MLISVGVGLPLSTALVFGALIAATDPVAVVALFRALGRTKQLTLIVEGESLFNDGTAIVIFNLLVAAALPAAIGAEHAASSGIIPAIADFLRVALGGIGIGIGLGWLVSRTIARLDDHLIETTLTTVLAFGAYLIAEELHVSGVLAVVAAGMMNGNLGQKGMSPTTRIVLYNFWEFLAFIANSLLFLLLGLAVDIPQLLENIGPIAIAVVAVLVGRAIVVYGLTWLVNRRRERVPQAYKHVLFWGGLRGAVSLALVLSLPASFADRTLLQVMTFGVVLFTLLAQGTTTNLLLRRLGLVQRTEAKLEYERRHGRLQAARAARERVHQLYTEGLLSTSAWEDLAPDLDRRIQEGSDAQRELLREHPALRNEERDDARREGLRAERATLSSLLSQGIISEPIFDELVGKVDAELDASEHAESLEESPVIASSQA